MKDLPGRTGRKVAKNDYQAEYNAMRERARSTISASATPLASPIGSIEPARAESGSVVGLPFLSTAQPSGIFSPRCFDAMTLPRATFDSDRSITRASGFSSRSSRRAVVPPVIVIGLTLFFWQLLCSAPGAPLPSPSKVISDSWDFIADPFFDNGGIDKGIFWLVWVPAGVLLVAAWFVILSPLLLPYLALRWAVGAEQANRLAWMALAVVVGGICLYQVALWVADPMSYVMWGR